MNIKHKNFRLPPPLFLLLFLHTSCFLAQDTIALKIGIWVPARVITVGDTVIYRPWGAKDSVKNSKFMRFDVSYIRYTDGEIQSFENQTKPGTRQLLIKGGSALSNETIDLGKGRSRGGYAASVGFLGRDRGPKNKLRMEIEIGLIQKGGSVYIPQPYVDNNGIVEYSPITDKIYSTYYFADFSVRYYFLHYLYVKAGLTATYLNSFSFEDHPAYFPPEMKKEALGVQTGVGMRTNGKRCGVFVEILGMVDITPLGPVSSEDAEVYRNSGILTNGGIYFNLGAK
jgi:hypothetical protein